MKVALASLVRLAKDMKRSLLNLLQDSFGKEL
jgi:hypothetical protein